MIRFCRTFPGPPLWFYVSSLVVALLTPIAETNMDAQSFFWTYPSYGFRFCIGRNLCATHFDDIPAACITNKWFFKEADKTVKKRLIF